MGDVHDVLEAVTSRCPDSIYLAAGLIVDSEARRIPYVLSTGGQVFGKTLQTIQTLHAMEVDMYIASGDRMSALTATCRVHKYPQGKSLRLCRSTL